MRRTIIVISISIICIFLISTMSKMNSVQANSDCQRTILQYSFEFDAVYYYSENRSLTELPYTTSTVFTPNGTEVSVKTYLDDYSETEINYYVNVFYPSYFPLAILIGLPTTQYNCHSYAWYSQNSETNHYWMPYPTEYYLDYSYYEVYAPQVGDIICYFDNNGTPNNTADDENLHSGIVESINDVQVNNICGNSSLVNVISKWGAHGLFSHRGDYCPYTSTFNGDADYVKYYRPRTNETFNLTNPSTNTTQTIQRNCSVSQNSNNTNNYAMYELDIEYRKDYEFEVSSNHELDVRLYDEHMQLINTYPNITYENGIYTYDIVREMYIGTYYLRVAYDDSSDYGTIATSIFNAHKHYYHDHYSWQSFIQHKAYCACGTYANRPHVTSSNAFQNGEQYAECSECHGLASVGIIYGMIQNIFPYTLNGSFILPNGVIVLVDEDYEAYMNDTLVFINPNDNIDRGNTFIPCLIRKEDNYWINTLQ